ncbi:8-oxo-dGTP pyrophosphatase MutT (NUDIX family) [Sphingomonas sp. BE138]|uniref:NUDIX domain-containing protein n=1 Tax=Sphingomonas sp. BE138 TaxID=2817845 RepID=UPI00285DAC92|nr:NUDIX domain-containing protein [Sphingomonas sp. BE138]MDR6787629.1 8-oxo-dGTP pyrophosphatase MutT (NUDIX family) [Sphingomonas sp. BE138]
MSRVLLQLAYRVRLRVLALLRWRTRGVKVLVFDGQGRVLLVRHRYGRSDLHMLPGGGIARGEPPAAAAVREVREETGCTLRQVTFVARYESRAERRRDTVDLFHAMTDDAPIPDARELEAACFHALDTLPAALSPATRRRIDEWRGVRERSATW